MEFSRKKEVAKGESKQNYDDLGEYIEKIINVYSSADISHDFFLTSAENRFLVSTVIMINEGITNPISNAGVQIYKKYFNYKVTRRDINTYLRKLSKKFWVEYDVQGKYVKVPMIFEGINKEKDSVEFKIKIELDATHRRDNDGDSG